MRSASIPQNCRLMNAQASSTDSIAAPCVGTMPRSVQNATRWPFGTAIGMQQKNAAMQISASARLAFMPSTVAPLRGSPDSGCGGSGSGAGRRHSRVSGRITTITTTAYASIVVCHPYGAMPRSNTEGQTTPAMYWPDEINASAEPRRRSNQRVT